MVWVGLPSLISVLWNRIGTEDYLTRRIFYWISVALIQHISSLVLFQENTTMHQRLQPLPRYVTRIYPKR